MRGDMVGLNERDPDFIVYHGVPNATASAAANVTAWNNAVSALPAVGGTIFVRGGTYYVNGNLAINRSDVHVVGEAGAAFKLVGGQNFCILVIGPLGGTPFITDVTIEKVEFDGTCVLQDIATTPGAVGITDSASTAETYNGQVSSVTNVTNATITVTGAGWTTNQFAGMYLTTAASSAAAGASLPIASNTATVLTLTGVFATPPVAADQFTIASGVYSRIISSVTNVTNSTITIGGTNTWGTTRYVGMYVNIITGPAAGVSKLITAHTTGGVLTLSGVYGTPPVATNLIEISTQPKPTSASWEATFSACGIVARSVFRLTIEKCYVHDYYGTGVEINQCGSVSVQNNTIDNTGLQFSAGPGNGISCLGPSATPATFPSTQINFNNNRIRRVSDVGIDIHGNGSLGVTCIGNTISQTSVAIGGAATGWGISCEIEAADASPNIGTTISANNITHVTTALSITNTGNATQYFAGIAVTGNAITNCAVGVAIQGAHIAVTGNTIFNVATGISSNNDIVTGSAIERDWVISSNTIQIDPTQTQFGNSAIFLRWQAVAAGATIGTVTGATGNLTSPIVLTLSGGWVGTGQPVVGSILNVVGLVGNTGGNGAWVASAVTATTVTLNKSVGNGTWSSGGIIQLSAHPLDSVVIEGNNLLGQGPVNAVNTHTGIYIEALSNGTANSAINHVTVGSNNIHGFYNGVYINSGATNAMVNGVEIRTCRIWNCANFGILIAGSQVDSTVIESCNLAGVAGALSGTSSGVTGTTDVIRNNRGWNPHGVIALPQGSIPATPITATTYFNDLMYDCTVYVSGTISAISVLGQVTGVTVAAAASAVPIRIPVGANISVTGTSLAWVWISD